MHFDVVIVGGGPGGSTCGSFLRKYRPSLKVGLFEQSEFPREHVGESQLPSIGKILDELGIWDRIEAADFPVKIGATYRWGRSDELWDFHFLPNGEFEDKPRPGNYEGQRLDTAFQVDRAKYDKILLDFAVESGCDLFQPVRVREVVREGDRIISIVLDDGTQVTARYFVDATGHVGLLRRALGIEIEEPSSLRNVAFWDYWEDAEWAVTLGKGGTRIQIMSVGYGWIWFIPVSATRTSIGFVCPADYYKSSTLKPEELYLEAIKDDPRISQLVSKAKREMKFSTTKDWSFLASRMSGENWVLVGEAAGFADPILSAGLTLTHTSAREAAFTIIELERGGHAEWLRTEYNARNRRRIIQHIRFADFWYATNKHFSELKEFTSVIAKDAGLELDAESAFRWLGTGGFVDEDLMVGGLGTFGLTAIHLIAGKLSGDRGEPAYAGYNGFVLNLEGAKRIDLPHYEGGRVLPVPAYTRGGKVFPLSGLLGWLHKGLVHSPRVMEAFGFIAKGIRMSGRTYDQLIHEGLLQSLEGLIRDGWVECRRYKNADPLSSETNLENSFIMQNRDEALPDERLAPSLRDALS